MTPKKPKPEIPLKGKKVEQKDKAHFLCGALKCIKCNSTMVLDYKHKPGLSHDFPCEAFCLDCGLMLIVTNGGGGK